MQNFCLKCIIMLLSWFFLKLCYLSFKMAFYFLCDTLELYVKRSKIE